MFHCPKIYFCEHFLFIINFFICFCSVLVTRIATYKELDHDFEKHSGLLTLVRYHLLNSYSLVFIIYLRTKFHLCENLDPNTFLSLPTVYANILL